MSDIAARLRRHFDALNNPPSPELPDGSEIILEAATEIERLRVELTIARDAFDAIATDPCDLNPGYDHYALARAVARQKADLISANVLAEGRA